MAFGAVNVAIGIQSAQFRVTVQVVPEHAILPAMPARPKEHREGAPAVHRQDDPLFVITLAPLPPEQAQENGPHVPPSPLIIMVSESGHAVQSNGQLTGTRAALELLLESDPEDELEDKLDNDGHISAYY